MKIRWIAIFLMVLTACSSSLSLEDHKEMRKQVEYLNVIMIGKPELLTETTQWQDVSDYLRLNEGETYRKFMSYDVDLIVRDKQYLILLKDRCDGHLVMYDFSCTTAKLDGALYETNPDGTLHDILAPECAKGVSFIK